MPIQIGKEEVVMAIAFASASATVLTLYGRWSGRRAQEHEATTRAAIADEMERDDLKRLKADFKEHVDQSNRRANEVQKSIELSQVTARNLDVLADKVEILVDGAHELNGRLLKFMTDAVTQGIVLKPAPPQLSKEDR